MAGQVRPGMAVSISAGTGTIMEKIFIHELAVLGIGGIAAGEIQEQQVRQADGLIVAHIARCGRRSRGTSEPSKTAAL